MVASSQVDATRIGVEVLRAGGNAVDAAVATAAALNVTEPCSTGIGGDVFALFYSAKTGAVHAMNASGRSPAALTLERAREVGAAIPVDHPYAVTVPGACAGWCDAVERWGRWGIADVLAPAIALAEEGFEVRPWAAWQWGRGAARLGGTSFLVEGRAPRAGERFRNPALAETLRAVAEGGAEAFYSGRIAAAIASALGVMTVHDLAAHRTTWEAPISTLFEGHRVWECAPNGQGLAALLALNLVSGLELGERRLHLLIEAMRVAFADARRYVADPSMADVPVEELLSAGYAEERRALISPDRANPDVTFGRPFAGSDTVQLCAVDAEGNACSFINSNYMGFGTGIEPAGCGFTLQNRGLGFSLEAGHPNALAPGKRPYHTIIPGLITRADGSLYGPFGVMGGFMQPQGHLQVVVGMLRDGLDPQQALNAPRFCLPSGLASSGVSLEPGLDAAALETLGHDVSVVTGPGRALFGRGQIIRHDGPTTLAGSDPRADGTAIGVGY